MASFAVIAAEGGAIELNAGMAQVGDADIVPLSERFKTSYASAHVGKSEELADIRTRNGDPHVASNPEQLYRLQMDLDRYIKEVSLLSQFAKHGVDTIQTLLKS